MEVDKFLANPPSVLWGLAVLAGIVGFGWLVWALSPFFRQKTSLSGGQYETLDGLRGLLAPAVFISHASSDWVMHLGGPWVPASDGYNAFGRVAVWLFFCITAFLFWGKVLDGRLNIPHHARSRILRICPLYLFMALMTTAIIMVRSGHLTGAPYVKAAEWARLYSFGFFNLTPDHIHVTPSAVTVGIMWTLQCEWLFYIVLPMIAFCRDFKRWVVLAIFAIAIVSPKISPLPADIITVYRRPIGSFLIGMFTAYAVRRRPDLLAHLKKNNWAALFVLAAAAGSSLLLRNQPLLLTLVIMPVFVIVISGNDVFGLLTNRATKTLGAMSYSIYLLHPLVLYLGRPLLAAAVHRQHPTLAFWSGTLFLGAAMVALSAATFRYVEAPFMDLERWFRQKPARRPEPAAALSWDDPPMLASAN